MPAQVASTRPVGQIWLSTLFYYFKRGGRREKERDRNINVWLPLVHPYWGPGLQPRHVP